MARCAAEVRVQSLAVNQMIFEPIYNFHEFAGCIKALSRGDNHSLGNVPSMMMTDG